MVYTVMMKQQRGAAKAVMDVSLFMLLMPPGLLCSTSGFLRTYYYINQSMTWEAAQSYCRQKHIDLAAIDSMNDVNKLINTVNPGYSGSVWIGLKRATLSRWVWSTGEDTVSQYSNWHPYNPSGDGPCVDLHSGHWNDLSCSHSLNFVCYNESVGNILITTRKTLVDAQSYCRQYHTDLVTIHNSVEQNQIYSMTGVQWVWIGLLLDSWQWSDQWNFFFRYWAAGQPTTGDCVAMSTTDSGKWATYSCDQPHPFICYDGYQKQLLRLNLSCDGKCNLDDPSLQTLILKKIGEKLKSMGLGNYISINWRKTEG